jgi:DNA-binding GntR family transcriptional regulator
MPTRSHTATSSRADHAYETLRDLLITLEIPPGAPLSEPLLMERLGVGRTPLREAVHRLEAEKLVRIFPRRGTFAAEINLDDLALITDLREELEGHAAARAAERATAADRTVLERLLPRLAAATTRDQIRIDSSVHRAIYAAAHNRFLAETATEYHNLSLRIWHLFIDRLPDISSHVAEHQEIIHAILAGDDQEARSAAAAHVRSFQRAVKALV